jgi:hypothetical protein
MADIMARPMTSEEAQTCVTEINKNIRHTRILLLDLYEREGWKALGYKNWRECVTVEFKQHQSYLYRQLEAAKAERNILSVLDHALMSEIPESHLRPLASLSSSDQREAYQKAIETAPEGKVTAKHVEETVREIKAARGPEKKRTNWLHNAGQEPEVMSDEFRRAYEAMARAIINARNKDWETTSRVTAVKHIVTLLNIASGQREDWVTSLSLAS